MSRWDVTYKDHHYYTGNCKDKLLRKVIRAACICSAEYCDKSGYDNSKCHDDQQQIYSFQYTFIHELSINIFINHNDYHLRTLLPDLFH